ncbi:MAG: AbrB/MazE/SpoVT family DNA-binding domain-containing protein [Armatimonadota bacterium]
MKFVELSTRGQITIPVYYRRELELQPGDILEVALDDGFLRLRPTMTHQRAREEDNKLLRYLELSAENYEGNAQEERELHDLEEWIERRNLWGQVAALERQKTNSAW